jgi:hypothetical protein
LLKIGFRPAPGVAAWPPDKPAGIGSDLGGDVSNISLQQRAPNDLPLGAAQKLPYTVIHSLNADFEMLCPYSGRS